MLVAGVLFGAAACGLDAVGGAAARAAEGTEPAAAAAEAGATASPGDPGADASVGPPDAGGPDAPCTDAVLAFDGVDDVARVPDEPSLDLAGDFSVEAWIKPGPRAATDEMHLVSHHDFDGGSGWVLLLDKGRVELIVYGRENFDWQGYSAGNAEAPAYVVPGKWAHVAGTLHGRTLRVYYDGVLRDTQEIGALFVRGNYQGDLHLGRAAWKDDYRYEGELDDVRLSRLARYVGATAPKPTTLLPVDAATVAAWRFDEVAGTTLLDATSNHRDGAFLAGPSAPKRTAGPCVAAR